MIVCVCHKVSDKQIKSISQEFELRSLEELQQAVDVCMTCRKCETCVRSLLIDAGECDGSTLAS